MISPNPGKPQNLAIVTIACGWTFTTLASLTLVSFFWDHKSRTRAGDYMMVLAFIIAVALVILTTWAILNEDFGRQVSEVSKDKQEVLVKTLIANEVLWATAGALIRANNLLLIRAIFDVKTSIRWLVLILLVLLALHSMVTLLITLLICHPISAAWDTSIKGECGDQILSYVLLESVGALLDLIILLIPFRLLMFGLQITLERKLRVLSVLSTGLLVFIITGLRIKALHFVNSPDFTFSGGYLGLLSEIGALLGIIFCCAPSVVGKIGQIGQIGKLFRRRRNSRNDHEMAKLAVPPEGSGSGKTFDNGEMAELAVTTEGSSSGKTFNNGEMAKLAITTKGSSSKKTFNNGPFDVWTGRSWFAILKVIYAPSNKCGCRMNRCQSVYDLPTRSCSVCNPFEPSCLFCSSSQNSMEKKDSSRSAGVIQRRKTL
ncbi:hypothetical protein ACLMJK_009474 [Lecanora helva]